MKTTVERIDDTTVKLTVTVEASRVKAAIDAAARELSGSIKVPGFRPGRVPRRVLESRIGKHALLDEAVRDALPDFYTEAVAAEELVVIAPPEFEVQTFEEGQDAAFTATVEVRPEVPVPDFASLQVAHPEWEVTEEELDAQLEELRQRFAELETIQRPLQPGDFAVVTVTGNRHGTRVDAASAEDVLVEVADPETSGRTLDRELTGASSGAILRFNDTFRDPDQPGAEETELAFTVLVKETKTKVLPPLDDDFAITASEFDTMEELRADLRTTMGRQKRAFARQALRAKVIEAVSNMVEVALPPSMVMTEQEYRIRRLVAEAERYGLTFEQYLQALDTPAEDFAAQLQTEARATVRAQLVVDAVGGALGIDVTREDLGEEVTRQSARLNQPPEEVARQLTAPGRIEALVTDAFRRKTIDALVAGVQVIGAPPPDENPDDNPDDDPDDDPDQDMDDEPTTNGPPDG